MDIMLGKWVSFRASAPPLRFHRLSPHRVPTQAAANLQGMDDPGLDQFAEVLDMENPDLYKWLTGQAPVPDEVWPAASSACIVRPWLISPLPGPPQIKNDVLRRMLADLEAERVPKVTVASTVEFKGAVWE